MPSTRRCFIGRQNVALSARVVEVSESCTHSSTLRTGCPRPRPVLEATRIARAASLFLEQVRDNGANPPVRGIVMVSLMPKLPDRIEPHLEGQFKHLQSCGCLDVLKHLG